LVFDSYKQLTSFQAQVRLCTDPNVALYSAGLGFQILSDTPDNFMGGRRVRTKNKKKKKQQQQQQLKTPFYTAGRIWGTFTDRQTCQNT